MRPYSYLLSLLVLTSLLSSCGTLGSLGLGSNPEARVFINDFSRMPDRNLTAGGSLTFDAGLEEAVTVPVQFIAHSRLGVLLSVRPLGVMEAVRVTVTDREMLILDRLNKRYARMSLGSTSTKIASSLFGFNPYALKSLLGNEPFSDKSYGADALGKLKFSSERGRYKFTDSRPRIDLTFDEMKRLTRSYYEPAINMSILADYGDFRGLAGGGAFPSQINMAVEMGIKDYRLNLRLRDIRPYAGQEITTVPPSGYSEMSMSDMTDVLGFVSKLLF